MILFVIVKEDGIALHHLVLIDCQHCLGSKHVKIGFVARLEQLYLLAILVDKYK